MRMATRNRPKARLRTRDHSPDILFGPKKTIKKRDAVFHEVSPKKSGRSRNDFTIEGLELAGPQTDPYHLSNISPTFTNADLRLFTPTKTYLHELDPGDEVPGGYGFEDMDVAQFTSGDNISSFSQDNFLEPALMDTLGTFVHDSFIYSNDNALTTAPERTPSPASTPVMSPETLPTEPQSKSTLSTPEKEKDASFLEHSSNSGSSAASSPSKLSGRTRAKKPRLSESTANIMSNSTVIPADDLAKGSSISIPPIASSEQQESMKQRLTEYIMNPTHQLYERPGKLISLRMSNFMCHTEFTQFWDPHVNYVIGNNGSGKSAILTAILLGLGSKANLTGRANSAKEFIRYGKTSATIEITLTNDGILDSSKYGNTIGIKRVIRCDGTSRYQVRTPDLTVRQLNRKELELINATLQIMPSNPVMFLNQEKSRNFMREADPSGTYNYFYRGMLLEQCENLHERAQLDIEAAKATLVTKTKMLEDLQATATDLRKEYERIKDLEKGTLRLKELDNEYNWAIVQEKENDLAYATKDYSAVQKQCKENEVELESVNAKLHTLESNMKSYTIMIKNLTDAMRDQREKYKQKQKEMNTWGKDLRTQRYKKNEVIKAIANYTAEVREIETNIEQKKKQIESDYERKAKKLAADRENYEEKIRLVKEKQAQETARKEEADAELEKCRRHEAECDAKYKDPEKHLREKREELKQIEKNKNAKYSRFGTEMVRLMADIEAHVRKGAFKEPPLGPQSACFTVKEEYSEFATLIEHIMGASLLQFCVCHDQDMKLLQKLIDKQYTPNKQKPDIHFQQQRSKQQYKLVDIKRNTGFDTVLSAIDIPDDGLKPLIINWLVDSRRVERVILFHDSKQADDVMRERVTVPRGCELAFTLDGNRIQPDPNYRSYTIADRLKKKSYYVQVTSDLQNDELVKLQIHDLEVECAQFKRELELAKESTRRARSQCAAIEKQQKVYQKEMASLITALRNLEVLNNQAPDLASYEDGLDDLQSRIQQKNEEQANIELKIKELEPAFETAKAALKEADTETTEIQNKIDELNNQKDSTKELHELGTKSKNLASTVEKLTAQRDKLEKKVKEAKAILAKKMKEAEASGDRVSTSREPSAIKDELKSLMDFLDKNKHRIPQKMSIKQKWESANKTAAKVREEIRLWKGMVAIIEPTLKLHRFEFNKRKEHYGIALQASFRSLVSSRNLGGELHLDYKEKTLWYWVSPDSQSEDRAKQNFKQTGDGDLRLCNKRGIKDYALGLSGGERSSATICFLVALWKTMEAPFYILDEFDVFMDPKNRVASQKILNCHTESQPEAQFFFFSPLGLDTLPNSKNTKILRLKAPERESKLQAGQSSPEGDENDPGPATPSSTPPRKKNPPRRK